MENKLINTGQNSIMDNFIETDDILKDMRQIIESSQKAAHQAVNMTLVQRNWMMGYRIASEELHGEKRAEYGTKIIKKLSKELSTEYGKVLQKQIYTIFIHFIKLIQRFSTQRVENLNRYYHGHIIAFYYK